MNTARITIDPDFRIAPVNPRLFGALVEHMGRCVYSGIFEPEHPRADSEGFRIDVLDLVRELGVTVVRYPGGNFVSGYNWEDGVGPRSERPTRLDLAWRSTETNHFGLNEFMTWAQLAEVEPMLAVNLGTRGVAEACSFLEYANHPGGTRWSDLRSAHGYPKAHAIALWCLGNEMDGPWQIGHKSAEEYGRLAAETAKAMRLVDPAVQLVACGSSNERMPTFGSWEATVLDHTFDHVDYISLHAYFENAQGDRGSFLGSSLAMDRFIEGVIVTADHVAAKRRSRKKLMLSFDEWNVWYSSRFAGQPADEWDEAPRLSEDEYTVEDAVVVGSLMMSLLRHADRVGVACLAQLVNVIAPIRAEPGGPSWRQTTFYPFALTAKYARGEVLRVEPVCETYPTAMYGDVPVCDAVATYDVEGSSLTLFAVNRGDEDTELLVNVRALGPCRVIGHQIIGGQDLEATNTAARPDVNGPRSSGEPGQQGDLLRLVLPPVSWSLIRAVPVSHVRG